MDNLILLVDDDTLLLDSMAKLINKIVKINCIICDSSIEAKNIINENYDSITMTIIDNIMPNLSGAELCKYIKYNHPEIKVILISGLTNNLEEVAKKCNADAFITKPIQIEELAILVSEYI